MKMTEHHDKLKAHQKYLAELGWKLSYHVCSDTWILYNDKGRMIMDEGNTCNSQGDRYIYWVQNEALYTAWFGPGDGSKKKVLELVERLAPQ